MRPGKAGMRQRTCPQLLCPAEHADAHNQFELYCSLLFVSLFGMCCLPKLFTMNQPIFINNNLCYPRLKSLPFLVDLKGGALPAGLERLHAVTIFCQQSGTESFWSHGWVVGRFQSSDIFRHESRIDNLPSHRRGCGWADPVMKTSGSRVGCNVHPSRTESFWSYGRVVGGFQSDILRHEIRISSFWSSGGNGYGWAAIFSHQPKVKEMTSL